MGKHQKMSVLHSFKHQKEAKAIVLSSKNEVLFPPSPAKVSKFLKKSSIVQEKKDR